MYRLLRAAVSDGCRRLSRDRSGQDLIEYALLASFLTVAVAAFFPMDIAPNISQIMSKVSALLASAPDAPPTS
jgi:Flp pilus assembly pilin Flp